MHTFKRFEDAKSGSAITVKVTPHAKQTGVLAVMDDGTIKIQVAAPAEGGRANDALVAFLATTLNIPASQVDIVAGHASERKLISLVGVTPKDVDAKLYELAGTARAAKKGRAASKSKANSKPKARPVNKKKK